MLAALLDKLDDLLDNAKPIPLTAQVRIDKEDFRAILDQMRSELQDLQKP